MILHNRRDLVERFQIFLPPHVSLRDRRPRKNVVDVRHPSGVVYRIRIPAHGDEEDVGDELVEFDPEEDEARVHPNRVYMVEMVEEKVNEVHEIVLDEAEEDE